MATSEAPADSTKTSQLVSVTYQSPHNPSFAWKEETTIPPTDKAAYLQALRKATAKMQEQINAELTARMEEDKAREAANSSGAMKARGAIDEAKEEDNYGEEVPEED